MNIQQCLYKSGKEKFIMEILSTVKELKGRLSAPDLSPVGFVPTMGALHQGHIALVQSAMKMCPVVVVSIFVNPTQFNDKNDLRNYPRTPEKDFDLLSGVLRENDIVFTPGENEIYPEEDKRKFDFGNLENVMEGIHRPGHFNGVAQVVSRLFDIVRPEIAIFGLKDFQQLAIIKSLVRQTSNKVKIIEHPIVREDDGLAMSSRNRLLNAEMRRNAPIIYQALKEASCSIANSDIPDIKSSVRAKINNTPGLELEYFEIVDDISLVPVISKKEMMNNKTYFGCIAVHAGKIRLIDNIKMDCSVPKG
jgi:pantoate--beta-alanine ligase